MTCKYCQQGTHLLNGIHSGEQWFAPCERNDYRTQLNLEPKSTDTWHQPEKRSKSAVPFTFGGDAA